jgi:Holliday junction DNA helicase RuvA
MIGYLQGEILENVDGKLLLGVGDRSSFGIVGYSVSIPQSAAYGVYRSGQRIELFVYAHIREEAFDLYGFHSKFEKELFLTILTVNGIGPKSALGTLSSVESSQLVDAIIQGDQVFLTRIPGIGKKTAERMVVELRDTLKKKVDLGLFSKGDRAPKSSSKISLNDSGSILSDESIAHSNMFQDAKAALLGLGYREQEVHQLLNRVLQDQDFHPQRPEDLIRTVLRQLA